MKQSSRPEGPVSSARDAAANGSGDGSALLATSSKRRPASRHNNSATSQQGQDQELLEKGISSKQGEDLAEEEEDWDEQYLTEDIYSLLYACQLCSAPFFYCVASILFQWCMIGLVLYDVLDLDSDGNPLKIPPGVPMQVTICQGLALILAAAMQTDLLKALIYLHQGDDPKGAKSLPGASKFKWYFAATSQLLAGASLNLVIFVLVMQATDIIGMFLNFAALMFISEIDDISFKLARHGFIARPIQEACEAVSDAKIPAKRQIDGNYRRIMFLIIVSGLLAGYGILVYKQLTGEFICTNIYVQFGDDFGTPFAAFSGVYSQTNELVNGRDTYVEVRRKDHPDGTMGHIGYCMKEKAWALYLNKDTGPCDWEARSPETESYDVTTTASSNWATVNPTNLQTLSYVTFSLSCNDCNTDLCNPDHGTCNGNVCECKPDRYGVNCEFDKPCEELTIDFRQSEFPLLDSGFVKAPLVYDLLRDEDDNVVEIYDKPVYSAAGTNDPELFGNETFAIFFTGRRFAMILHEEGEGNEAQSLLDFLDGFHAYYSSPYYPIFLSAPMDVGSSSDALGPERLQWLRSRGSINENNVGPVFPAGAIAAHTSLLCSACDNVTNPCLNDHQCGFTDEDTGEYFPTSCGCLVPYYVGALCELPQDCEFTGCENGGECQSTGVCECPSNSTGAYCEYAFV